MQTRDALAPGLFTGNPRGGRPNREPDDLYARGQRAVQQHRAGRMPAAADDIAVGHPGTHVARTCHCHVDAGAGCPSTVRIGRAGALWEGDVRLTYPSGQDQWMTPTSDPVYRPTRRTLHPAQGRRAGARRNHKSTGPAALCVPQDARDADIQLTANDTQCG